AAAHLVYLGCKQRFRQEVNDRIDIEPYCENRTGGSSPARFGYRFADFSGVEIRRQLRVKRREVRVARVRHNRKSLSTGAEGTCWNSCRGTRCRRELSICWFFRR